MAAAAWALLSAAPDARARVDPADVATTPKTSETRRLNVLVKADIDRIACASIAHTAPTPDRIALSGFIGSVEDKATLLDKLALLVPRSGIDDEQLVVRPWPQCEALLSFAQPFERPEGLVARLIPTAPGTGLRDGDRLILEVATPQFPAYLYVTYLEAGGDAVHLFQPRGRVPRPIPPSTTLRIGEPPSPIFRVSQPFGDEMIVVLASASPFFEGERPESEIEREYLSAFRSAVSYKPPGVAVNRDRRVAGTVIWLRTQKAETRP